MIPAQINVNKSGCFSIFSVNVFYILIKILKFPINAFYRHTSGYLRNTQPSLIKPIALFDAEGASLCNKILNRWLKAAFLETLWSRWFPLGGKKILQLFSLTLQHNRFSLVKRNRNIFSDENDTKEKWCIFCIMCEAEKAKLIVRWGRKATGLINR